MAARPLSFKLEAQDPNSQARAGVVTTPHGRIKTPVFMPVGTQGAVRNLTPEQVKATGAQIILANTYHLNIRPGSDLVARAGGLHKMMGYDVPILTDSGGFQVFSLPKKEILPDGVAFQYEINGEKVMLTPELSMDIQQKLGADIAMAFDECAPYPCSYEYAVEALERTTLWEKRSKAAHSRPDQALFGIIQGSVFEDLRKRSAREITAIGFDGYAIGGLSVGEGLEIMSRVLEYTVPEMPTDKPRYLMGVGLPEDLLAAVELGVDMFDCVIPTRHARGGILYTFQGRMRIQHTKYRRDMYPIDTACTCYTCQNFSRAYLRHLFTIREVLANTLASIHNIHFYQELMARMRKAILEGRFVAYKREFMELYKPDAAPVRELPDEEDLPMLPDYDEERPRSQGPRRGGGSQPGGTRGSGHTSAGRPGGSFSGRARGGKPSAGDQATSYPDNARDGQAASGDQPGSSSGGARGGRPAGGARTGGTRTGGTRTGGGAGRGPSNYAPTGRAADTAGRKAGPSEGKPRGGSSPPKGSSGGRPPRKR